MMEKTKRVRWKWILRIGFCLAVIAAMVLIGAVLAGAEEPKYSEGLKFTSNGDGTCSVSGIGTCTDTEIVIPPVSPEGDKVTEIRKQAFYLNKKINSVTIPVGVTSIGEYAFQGCSSMTRIIIPEGVASIGKYAFTSCYGITEIIIPNSVTSIGSGAFSNCESLRYIFIPQNVVSIGAKIISGCISMESLVVDSRNMAYRVVNNCLIEIDTKRLICGWGDCSIPNDGSVVEIGEHAFYKNGTLVYLEIPNSITKIQGGAFAYCSKLKYVSLPESITHIYEWAFEYCYNLETIVFRATESTCYNAGIFLDAGVSTSGITVIVASNVKKIPSYLFGYSSDASGTYVNHKPKISQVIFEEGSICTEIGDCAFASSIAMSIVLPDSIEKIGDYAFWGAGLQEINFPDSIVSIGERAFEGKKFTSITIPKSLKNLGARAFANCYYLEYIYYNAVDLGYLGTDQYCLNAFWNAGKNGDGIKVIVGKEVECIPGSLFEVYSNYFDLRSPPKIVRVEFEKDSVCTKIGAWSFSDIISLQELYLGANVRDIDGSAFAWCPNLETIVVDKDNDSLYCTNNCLMSFDGTVILGGANNTIPDDGTVKKIGAYAYHTRSVKNQYLPNGIERIDWGAFYGSFSTIVIPETVTYIDKLAFCAGGGIGMGYNQKITKLETAYFENTYGWYRIIHANNNRYPVDVTDPYESAKLLLSGRATSWLDESIRCTPTQFTITFIADGKTVATVPYWTTDHNIEIPAVPHKPGYTGVWEDFDLSNGGDITVHAIYTPTESKLTGASLSLGQSLALNYYAVLTPAHTAAQMRFTYHGETTLVSGVLDEASGEYKFIFGRIPPQCMGDNVKAELILISEDGTETVLDVKETYSVRAYCDDALAANPENEALATLLADLLAYGDAAQDYANYNEDTPVSDGFTVAPSEWEDVTDTDFILSDKTREDFCFSAAGVRFAYVNCVYFKIKAADLTGVTLTVNGKTYTADDLILVEDTADTYILYTDAVYATEFDKVFTAELVLNGEKIQTVTYSVKSYVCKKQNSSDTEIAALVKALYNYGLSAIAYKNAQ